MVNEHFFDTWSPQMAYVLGHFCADGSMFTNPRGSNYIAFYSVDRELLPKIRDMLNSNNKISTRKRSNARWNTLTSLQIGSKKLYSRLLKLGLVAAKAKRLSVPFIPRKYLRHFVRGYFDGDGCISYGRYKRPDRNKAHSILMVRFASGSRSFLEDLSRRLSLAIGLKRGGLARNTGGFHLIYGKNDSGKLFDFMYNNVSPEEYLVRKYRKFQEAVRLTGAVA